jgi:hypothetical protein
MLEIGPAPTGHDGFGRMRDKHQRGKVFPEADGACLANALAGVRDDSD